MERFDCSLIRSKAVIDKEHLCVGVFKVLSSPVEPQVMAF